MRGGDLGWWRGADRCGAMIGVNDDEGHRGEGHRDRPGQVPAGEPGSARGCGLGLEQFLGQGKRERDDGAAVCADGQVGEGLLVLVGRQGVLGEGAELVRVWMMPGLERFGHRERDRE